MVLVCRTNTRTLHGPVQRVVPSSAPRREASYALPRDAIRLFTNDERVLTLADRLWDRAGVDTPTRGRGRAPLDLSIDVRPTPARPPRKLTEQWAVGTNEVSLSV